VFNAVCRDGLECAGRNCLEGAPDQLGCFLACFNGDWEAAVNAVDALVCAERSCRGACN